MRTIFFTLILIFVYQYSNCQIVTVTLIATEDAAIGFHDGTNTANFNYGNAIQNAAFWIPATAAVGINANRALIKFNLSSIPSSVTIVSANLNLYGMGPYGTLNGHSGSSNACLIERITQNWSENIVTWSTQPTSTSLNSSTIANSNTNTQDYLNIPVPGMVADMYYNHVNYGFLLKLQNESLTNSMIFCSLNYTNTSKYPKLIVSYNNCSPVKVSQNKASICIGDSVMLTAQNANSYLWSNGASTSTIVVKPIISSVYTVTGNFTSCTSTSTLSVIVNPNPIFSIIGNTNICSGQSTTITATGNNSYLWSNGINSNSNIVNPQSNTIYTVTATSSNGCKSSLTSTVNVSRCDGLNETINEHQKWFPSPTASTIKKRLIANTIVLIYDQTGHLIFNQKVEMDGYFELDFCSKNFSDGIYLLKTITGDDVSIQRIIYNQERY